MKLKKTLSIIMAAALSVATLTGCSESTQNYVGEVSKVSSWESSSSQSTGKLNIEGQGIKQEITFESTGHAYKDKAYVDLKFNDPSEKLNIPEIKVYTIDKDVFINKSYYEGLYTMIGQEVPDKIKNINADYIGVDSGVDIAQFKLIMNNPDSILKLTQTVFGDSDIDLPYVQNGREYTMNLDSNAMVDLGVKGIKGLSNNLDNVNSTFGLGLNAQNISEVKAAINDESFNQGVEAVKTAIAGSTISTKEVFDDDKYTMDIDLNIKVSDKFNISASVNAVSNKTEKEEITLPNNCIKLSKEDYQRIFSANQNLTINNSVLGKAAQEVK